MRKSVGLLLMFAAGWVDTVVILVFFDENTSFMTGRVAKLGKNILNGELSAARDLVIILAAFIAGAALSTLLCNRYGLKAGLYLAGTIILVTALLVLPRGVTPWALAAIPLSMGAQNAATSLTRVNRTTHLTGPLTDLGIGLARGDKRLVLFWLGRALAFFAGVLAAYGVLALLVRQERSYCLALLIPGLIVILTGLFQQLLGPIPLLTASDRDL